MSLIEEANDRIIGLWCKNNGDYGEIRKDFDDLDSIDLTSVADDIKKFKLAYGYCTCMDTKFENAVKRTQPDGWITENPFIIRWNKYYNDVVERLMQDDMYEHNVCLLTESFDNFKGAKSGYDINLFGVIQTDDGTMEVYIRTKYDNELVLKTKDAVEVAWFLKVMCKHVVIVNRKAVGTVVSNDLLEAMWHYYLDRKETEIIMVIPSYAGSWANTIMKNALKYPNDESKIRLVDTWDEVRELISPKTEEE